MHVDPERIPRVLELYLQISQYPILGSRIRSRMRDELFSRGIIGREQFEEEVAEKAVLSQKREGVHDPFSEETADIWRQRVALVRDHLTDFYFAYNLPHSLFEDVVREVLAERAPGQEVTLPFNPELAPWRVLLAQGREYAQLPTDQRARVDHHLQEIKVVLIKSMISDQMDFVRLAKDYLSVDDFEQIGTSRIGEGKIGGKAAGMLLAHEILQRDDGEQGDMDLARRVSIPQSYFIGADVFYDFHTYNGYDQYLNQKYKAPEEIEADYPQIQEQYADARFPDEILLKLNRVLMNVGSSPIIVRSSSLLEDNFGYSFAGKYESIFCPNQGTSAENLAALTSAISQIYASVLNPDALIYRKRMGLVDYDERMAILIQKVQGRRQGRFFLPTLAGVGFSYNPFRWNRKIRPEEGMLRIVCGLGTRAVDRVGNDYPRIVALSHPQLRPEAGSMEVRRYSQHYVDVLDLKANAMRTVGVDEVLGAGFPAVELLASQDKGSYLQPIVAPGALQDEPLVLTFDKLVRTSQFTDLLRTVLDRLERAYGCPVDIEFTVATNRRRPWDFRLQLLQCRPLSGAQWDQRLSVPTDVPRQRIIFEARRMVPHGLVERIRYLVTVDPRAYRAAPDRGTRLAIARAVGRLNQRLEDEVFILMGPGRWGSSNVELGVPVSYADIHNTRALIEIAHSRDGSAPEVSYGTHFFQDLVETRIYPLPLYVEEPDTVFNERFLQEGRNVLAELVPEDAALAPFIKVIDVASASDGYLMELVMDSTEDEAMAYLKRYD